MGQPRPRRFGLLLPMLGTGLDAATFIGEMTDETRAAEEGGLDIVLVPEHHDVPQNAVSDPVAMSAWLLGRTSRVTVGSGVLVPALHHPVRLSEQGAILASASKGRFLMGVGAGYQQADFEAFDADIGMRQDTMVAALSMLRTAWRGDEVRPGRRLAPRPSTAHIPEIWVGAWSRWGVRAAAEHGDGWLADPVRSSDDVLRMAGWYREEADAADRPPRILLMRHLWVGATDAEARRTYARFIEPVYRYYLREGALGVPADSMTPASLTLDGNLRERVICGGPSTVVDQVGDLLERAGAEGCIFALRHPGGPPHAEVCAGIDMLCREVVPVLR